MSQFTLREDHIKKKARLEVSKTRSLLGKYVSKLKPEAAEIVREKLSQTEKALGEGNSRELAAKTAELERAVGEHIGKIGKSKLRQNVEAIFIALALALFIRQFVVQPFKIPSGSMIPTLLVGDHLLVSKFIYGTKIPYADIVLLPGLKEVKRGDIIVFIYPNPENDPTKDVHFIKRVVGLPGDKIDIRDRTLYVNEKQMPLKFLGDYRDERDGNMYDEYEEDLFGTRHRVIYRKEHEYTYKGNYIPVEKVPEGMYFVMGDNRDNSQDSREWGFVPTKNVEGRAFVIHWSWNWDNEDIANKVRWNRIGNIIQ